MALVLPRIAALLAALALLPTAAPSNTTDTISALDGSGEMASAPRRWANVGGAAARSGVGGGRALRDQPERAWSRPLRGQIEDGPLHWNDLVVVTARETAGRRRIYFLDLESGRDLVPSLPVASRVSLAPSLWSRAVVVRRSEHELAAFQVGDRRGTPFWSWRSSGAVGPPLAVGQDVFAATDTSLVRLRFGRREPVWQLPGRFRGSVTHFGNWLFAVRYDEQGTAWIVQVEATTGELIATIEAGHHRGTLPDQGERPLVAVLGSTVVVHHALPVVTGTGEATAVIVERESALAPLDRALTTSAMRIGGQCVAWNGNYVALLGEPDDGVLAVRESRVEDPLHILATADVMPAVLQDADRLARVDSVLYAGRFGVDLADGRVLWRLAGDDRTRSVPAGSGLLAVTGDATLESWTRPDPGEAGHELRRLEASLTAALAEEYVALAERAQRTRDPELLARIVQTARALGAGAARLAALDRHVDLLRSQRALNVNPNLRNELLAEETDLVNFVADGLWRRTQELGARRSEKALRYLLLAEVLRRAPGHAGATELVRSELPPELRSLPDFHAAEWLEFLRVSARWPVSVHLEERGSVSSLLRTARADWRRDLIAFESEHLVIVTTPQAAPGSVARCLATGELVCSALVELVGAGASDQKLPLQLFPDQGEYLRFAQDHVEGGAGLSWTAGHFDPDANLSRIFLPDDEGGWESVRRTYAHELTHHWLHERYSRTGTRSRVAQNGFWIVEGFASFVEEFAIDLEQATWATENARSHRLDVLAHSAADARIPWDELFELDQAAFQALGGETVAKVTPSWVLGRLELLSERSLFYFQAAAACRALFHADDGRYRAALLEYVENYYAGRVSDLDVISLFGASSEALGSLTLEYATTRE